MPTLTTPDFQTLVQLPESRRDEAWEHQFLDALINYPVTLDGDEPQPGPDGWPYLRVKTSSGREPFARVVEWCATRGIGVVVNAHKMIPDYVFTYGMIWNFRETGRFVMPQAPRADQEFRVPENAVMGAPTSKYLPLYARKILREFLSEQGFPQPKVLVISSRDYTEIDLAFSLPSLNHLDRKDQKVMAEALHWFLPTHYNLVFADEKGLPPFTAL